MNYCSVVMFDLNLTQLLGESSVNEQEEDVEFDDETIDSDEFKRNLGMLRAQQMGPEHLQ